MKNYISTNFRSKTEKKVFYQVKDFFPDAVHNIYMDIMHGLDELDIYIPSIKLNIEIDGPHHEKERRQKIDWLRDAFLQIKWIDIIRIPVHISDNQEKLTAHIESEVERILKKRNSRSVS